MSGAKAKGHTSGLGALDVGVELVALELQLAHPVFTTSPMLTMPLSLPSSTTGTCRNRRSVISDISSSTVSWPVQVAHVAGHDRGDRRVEHRVVVVQPAHDVALGDDPVDAAAVGADHERADVVLGEQPHQLPHGGVGEAP